MFGPLQQVSSVITLGEQTWWPHSRQLLGAGGGVGGLVSDLRLTSFRCPLKEEFRKVSLPHGLSRPASLTPSHGLSGNALVCL